MKIILQQPNEFYRHLLNHLQDRLEEEIKNDIKWSIYYGIRLNTIFNRDLINTSMELRRIINNKFISYDEIFTC